MARSAGILAAMRTARGAVPSAVLGAERDRDGPVLNEALHPLNDRCGQPPPRLNPGEIPGGHRVPAQRLGEDPRGGHRVGDGQIDADAADRRHRMRRVPDEQQAVDVPAVQPIQLHVKEFDVVERRQRGHPVGEPRHQLGHLTAQRLDALGPHRGVGALADQIGDLEVVATVDQRAAVAGLEDAVQPARIAVVPRQAEPPHVHRRAEVARYQPCRRAKRRRPAVAGHHQVGAHLVNSAVGVAVTHAGTTRRPFPVASLLPAGTHRAEHLRAPHQPEGRLRGRGTGQHLEEIPLRHQGDVFVRAGQPGQVDPHRGVLNGRVDALDQTVGDRRERRTEPQLIQ